MTLSTELTRLHGLLTAGAISDVEFAALKLQIISNAKSLPSHLLVQELEALSDLKQRQVLSLEEFETAKRNITTGSIHSATTQTTRSTRQTNLRLWATLASLILIVSIGYFAFQMFSQKQSTDSDETPITTFNDLRGTWIHVIDPSVTISIDALDVESFEVASNQIYVSAHWKPVANDQFALFLDEPTSLGAGGARLPFETFDRSYPIAVVMPSPTDRNRITIAWNGFTTHGKDSKEYQRHGNYYGGEYTRKLDNAELSDNDTIQNQRPKDEPSTPPTDQTDTTTRDLALNLQAYERCHYPPTCNALGVMGYIDVTSQNSEPIAITRVVINGRTGQKECDIQVSPPRTLRLGDSVTVFQWIGGLKWGMVSSQCGNRLVQVDIFSNQGSDTYTFQ
jgi:hypothetical protein